MSIKKAFSHALISKDTSRTDLIPAFLTIFTFTLIIIVLTPYTAMSSTILINATYILVSWPVVTIDLPNNTLGILVIVSSNVTQLNTAFTGMLTLENGSSYIVYGFIGTENVYIFSMEPITESQNTGLRNTEVILHGQRVAGTIIDNASINAGVINNTSTTVSSTARKATIKAMGRQSLYMVFMGMMVGSILSLIGMTMVMQYVIPEISRNARECLEDGMVRVIRKLGIREPSTTHRDLRRVLGLRVNEELLGRFLLMYEEGVYGGKDVDCKEYRKLLRKLMKSL